MGKRVTNKSAGLRRAPPGYALFCSHVAKQGVEYPPKRRLHAKATPNKREIVLQRWTFGCMCTFCFCVLMHGFTDVNHLLHAILCMAQVRFSTESREGLPIPESSVCKYVSIAKWHCLGDETCPPTEGAEAW